MDSSKVECESSAAEGEQLWTLRVTGLGHKLTLLLSPSQTLADLQREIAKDTGLLVPYQRLLPPRGCDRTKWADTSTLLQDTGMKDRTKLVLMHNEHYAGDKECLETLSAIAQEIASLEQKQLQPHVRSELATRICIRLDEVDTKGSDILRARRKELLKEVERIDRSTKQR